MKKFATFFFVFLVFVFSCTNNNNPKFQNEFENGSGIDFIDLNEEKLENLQLLGMVWGFLKYYHPNVAKGQFNWDYELFKVMPDYLIVETIEERDKILIDWINSLGKFKIQNKSTVYNGKEVKIYPDLDWINRADFSQVLIAKLNEVKIAKRKSKNYYVSLSPNVNNPVFENENSYSNMQLPDVGFRILALYRYWNIVQYYFPYKNLIEKDWKDVLKDFLPQLIAASNKVEYDLTLLRLFGQVHDSHAQLLGFSPIYSNFFGANRPPFYINFIEEKPVIVGFSQEKFKKQTGLEIGDVILTINNEPVENVLRKILPVIPASNYPTQLRNISAFLFCTKETSMQIEIERNNKLYTKEFKTYSKFAYPKNTNQKQDTCFTIHEPKIAYINHEKLKRKYLPELWKEFKATDGLVIDLRNYPTDFPLYKLGYYLMPKSTPFTKITNCNIIEPGLFTFEKTLNVGKQNSDYYRGKVVILVNEKTQSSAEFHAMAYRSAPNTIVVGSTTAGADGNVSRFFLPGGIETMISGIGIYYPDETETQRVGIIPDVEIKPTIEGIKAGRDEVLEKAIEIINESNLAWTTLKKEKIPK